uniref:DNA-directed RNA polymerase III subunit RPC3 n=1 Tax=Daphnia galeata TaxID=27404 RepID=A0A8J2RGW5_9CRUS|nr:unnamed protein product [Daphnia galeata]
MSSIVLSPFNQTCYQLINKYFGEIVGEVAKFLLSRRYGTLFNIKTGTGMSLWDVKRALAVLIHQNLVEFQANEQNPNIVDYSIIYHNAYCLLRYAKYLYTIKRIFGSSEEVLIEILLNIGQASASNVIFHSANKLNKAIDDIKVINPSDLYQSFQKLAANNFIIRCPKIEIVENMPKLLEFEEKDKFIVPQLEMEPIAKLLREKATQIGEHSDSEIIWRVNHQRFEVELRNVILVNAAARRVDETTGKLYHLILKLWREANPTEARVSNAVSYTLVKDAVRKNDGGSPMLMEHFDQYLRVLYEDSTGLISRVGDSGGGQFAVNYADVFENFACSILDSVVLERFGSKKALRIFRLTRMQKFMTDQDQMQKLAMVSPKDAKTLSYKLMKEGFLQLHEQKKATSNVGPVKSFNLFYVNLPEVVRGVLETSYKCVSNALERQAHDLTVNKCLLERHADFENILEQLRGEDAPDNEIAEFSDSMTVADKELVAKVLKLCDRLKLVPIQADETILILENYLKFHSMP